VPPRSTSQAHDDKLCVSCGRTIAWRKKWERNWPQVKYCSDGCRRAKISDVDRQLEQTILDLLGIDLRDIAPGAKSRDSENLDVEHRDAVAGVKSRQSKGRRAAASTICPSEAARIVGGSDESAWRPLMEPARRAARRLVAAGVIEVTQGGHVVDASTAKGPIRLRRSS
jgi:hypothetical protein